MEDKIRIIEVKRSIFADNDADAERLRQELKEKKVFLLNLMSSPGSGKTTTLLALAKALEGRIKMGVMEADIDADMTRQGLYEFGLDDAELVILENVGNLVCPAEFDTGAVKNMTILSVPEGDDKPLKYPLMYEKCDLLVVNKTDVMPYFDFSKEKLEANAKLRNPNITILYISAKTGEGVEALADWIVREAKSWRS